MKRNMCSPTGAMVFRIYIWSYSLDDELIGNHDQVFGRPTSYVPYNDGTTVFQNLNTEANGSEHMATKDKTVDLQYHLVTRKNLSSYKGK